SAVATLTVLVPPAITAQPQSRTNSAGTQATFSVAATGTAPLIYQWQLNGSNIADASGTDLTLNNVQATNAGNYSVQITNLAGLATSSNALLTVIEAPLITSQPLSLAIAAGSNVAFSVVAAGTKPLSYQWAI